MTTDIQMKVRGLCETLASAYASVAACHQVLADTLGATTEIGEVHHRAAIFLRGYKHDATLAEALAAVGDAADIAPWPDALERRKRAEVS